MKKIIAIDCDEVLANTVDSILWHYGYTFNNLPLTKESITSFYRHLLESHWASKEYTRNYREQFFHSPAAYTIPPLAWAIDWVRKLVEEGNTVYVVTSRWDSLEQLTIDRVEQHFSWLFTDIVFPKKSLEDHHLTNKADLMRSIWATYLVDDALHNCTDVVAGGYKAILLDYPWNQTESLDPNITRVPHREEIVKKIVAQN